MYTHHDLVVCASKSTLLLWNLLTSWHENARYSQKHIKRIINEQSVYWMTFIQNFVYFEFKTLKYLTNDGNLTSMSSKNPFPLTIHNLSISINYIIHFSSIFAMLQRWNTMLLSWLHSFKVLPVHSTFQISSEVNDLKMSKVLWNLIKISKYIWQQFFWNSNAMDWD